MEATSGQKQWFFRLLKSYLSIFIIIFISLVTLSAVSLHEFAKNAAVRSSAAVSNNVVKLIDNSLSSLEHQMFQAVNHKDIQDFYNAAGTHNEKYFVIRAASALQASINNPLVLSMYLYRPADNKVMSPSTFTDLDMFYDRDLIRETIDYDRPFVWQYKELSPETGTDRKYITLIKYTDLKGKGLLIVNVSREKLLESISQMLDTRTSYIQLVDELGQEILSTHDKTEASLTSLYHVRSDYTGWFVYSGTRSFVLSSVYPLLYFGIGSCFALFALGVLWTFHVTRRSYRPINTLLKLVNNRSVLPAKDKSTIIKDDEFSIITSRIEELYDYANDQFNKDKIVHDRNVFHEIVNGTNPDAQPALLQKLQEMDVDPETAPIMIALFEIDNYKSLQILYSRRDLELFKYGLLSVAIETSGAAQVACWVEWTGEQQYCAMFFLREEQSGEEIARICRSCLVWVQTNLHLTITIATSAVFRDISGIPAAYRQVRDIMRYKSSLGDNRVIAADGFREDDRGDLVRQLHLIEAIGRSFLTGDAEWRDHLRVFFTRLQQYAFTKTDLEKVLYYLIYHLQKEIMGLPDSYFAIWKSQIEPQLNRIVEFNETLAHIRDKFINELLTLEAEFNKLRENNSIYMIVSQVKEYVEANYSNPDLSLTHLSSRFHLNASYLSRLFKEQFGTNYVDFISKTRLENAKSLLQLTDLSIQEISVQVGYITPLTFIRAFKKWTGTTPGSYRKKEP